MASDIEQRLAQARSDLRRQNEQWRRVRVVLEQRGDERLAVPRTFLLHLDALARPHPDGIRA